MKLSEIGCFFVFVCVCVCVCVCVFVGFFVCFCGGFCCCCCYFHLLSVLFSLFLFTFLPIKATGYSLGLNPNLSKGLLVWKPLLSPLEMNGLWFNWNDLGPIRCEMFLAGGSGRELPHLLEFLLSLFSLILFWVKVRAKNSIALSLLAINVNWVKID